MHTPRPLHQDRIALYDQALQIFCSVCIVREMLCDRVGVADVGCRSEGDLLCILADRDKLVDPVIRVFFIVLPDEFSDTVVLGF